MPQRMILGAFVVLVMQVPASASSECDPWTPRCDGCCTDTWYAWKCTWHGPNALETPLRGYFIPRAPGCCSSSGCANCAEDVGNRGPIGTAHRAEMPSVGCLEPPQFERLGQIPNDLAIAGALPAAPLGQPAR